MVSCAFGYIEKLFGARNFTFEKVGIVCSMFRQRRERPKSKNGDVCRLIDLIYRTNSVSVYFFEEMATDALINRLVR